MKFISRLAYCQLFLLDKISTIYKCFSSSILSIFTPPAMMILKMQFLSAGSQRTVLQNSPIVSETLQCFSDFNLKGAHGFQLVSWQLRRVPVNNLPPSNVNLLRQNLREMCCNILVVFSSPEDLFPKALHIRRNTWPRESH
jgi:hypothetical protein